MNEYLLNESISDSMPKVTLAFSTFTNIMDVEKSRIMYSNLLKELQKKLVRQFPKREWEEILVGLKEHENDLNFFQGSGRGILLFVDSHTSYKIDILHDISPYVYVGTQFLLKDLFMLNETIERPKYLIEVGKDRLYSWSVKNCEPVQLKDLSYTVSDYFGDFDSNSNLNIGNYGGLTGKFHGHRTKDEEEDKVQREYYEYLSKRIEELSKQEHTKFILCGVQEIINKFLDITNVKANIFEIIDKPLSKASKKEIQSSVEVIFEGKLIDNIEKIYMEIEYAKRDGKIIHDVETIKMDINKGLVKQVIFFEKNDGYSLEQNQLMIHCIKSNLKPIVLKSGADDFAINAILY